MEKMKLKILAIGTILILIFSPFVVSAEIKDDNGREYAPTVTINIDPHEVVYEGDIIDCDITGNPTIKYWQINGQSKHTTFYGDDPIIFDPEPTPLNTDCVTLTVYAENSEGSDSDTVTISIKRIYFGDIHFHSRISDSGPFNIVDLLYRNAIKDNYLDFVCLTDHAEMINEHHHFSFPQPKNVVFRNLFQFLRYNLFGRDEWEMAKEYVKKYYDPGSFTTLLGFEWSAGALSPGGLEESPNGYEDVCHVNFYYRDVYETAPEYSAWDKYTCDDIFQAMADEWDNGHLNVGFPHHPLMGIKDSSVSSSGSSKNRVYTVNWTFLANFIENTDARDKVLRGAETYSKWGTAIGKYSDIPVLWPYADEFLNDHPDYWVENGLWEWSDNARKDQRFALLASSDTHAINRPGSASLVSRLLKGLHNPSGIMAAYTIHNTRGEIWDAMNNCSIYGSQVLKIRANVRFDGQMAYGGWINCTSPLNIRVTAQSTFPGSDSSGKSMCPHGYSPSELEYPIQDIWIIKKDRDKGKPWCKVIGHETPNEDTAVVTFEDTDVQPNDFYWVAIRQKGQELSSDENEYMAFIGPVFIDNVVS